LPRQYTQGQEWRQRQDTLSARKAAGAGFDSESLGSDAAAEQTLCRWRF
jgi:hypothetical protein